MSYEEFWSEKGKEPAAKWHTDKQNRVRAILKLVDYHSSFEVGCGDGEFSKLILEKCNGDATGIDLSNERLANSPYRYPLNGDFLKIDFNGQWDLVCCSHVLLHIRPKDVGVFYEKMVKITRKHIILIEPDMFLYDTLEWSEMNFPHDYNKLFGPFDKYPIDTHVTAFVKTL